MTPELGQFSLILALLLALAQATIPLAGAATGRESWMRMARSATIGQFVFVTLAFLLLTYAFIAQDFSVMYVARNSNLQLPLIYRISAVWGAHEGSFLLWAFILNIWSMMIAVRGRNLPLPFHARVLAIMGWISLGFLVFMLFTSNPFERLLPAVADGQDLNPLLQDPGLIFHPPMLYAGYVGFSVAFAFAIAGLLGGKIDANWVKWSRPWTNIAWSFLTFGIALGSWWAYYELGWGGWWFWDPVENASFMPWLAGTALIHSQAVTEKRGAFKSWTVLLAITAFSLSLLGTFLVRSGVLTSVHAFTSDPTRGVFILAFLGVVTGGSLLLYAMRAPKIHEGARYSWFSRESMLLVNNWFLIAATGVVLLGTIYPLIIDLLDAGKISVGPPYFHAVFPFVLIPLVLLIPVAEFIRWKGDYPSRIRGNLIGALLLAAALAALFLLQFDSVPLYGLAGVVGGSWIIGGSLFYMIRRWLKSHRKWMGIRVIPVGVVGMSVAHIGVGMFLIGVAFTETQSIEVDRKMDPGQTIQLGQYQFRFVTVAPHDGPNYQGHRGEIVVRDSDGHVATLYPEKRTYRDGRPMTEAAINPSLFRDIYVALGEPIGSDDAWAVRLYYKPFIRWIWLGSLLMMFGGVLATRDRRFREARIKARSRAALTAETA